MINGRPALKFRIIKSKGKDVDEQVIKIKGGYRKYKKHMIQFPRTFELSEIISQQKL